MAQQVTSAGLLSTLRDVAAAENDNFQGLHWEGSFEEYLEIVRINPKVTRTAFQRIYDMIISHSLEEYQENKEKIVHYKFFDDERYKGRDAIYGLERPLIRLGNRFQLAAPHLSADPPTR